MAFGRLTLEEFEDVILDVHQLARRRLVGPDTAGTVPLGKRGSTLATRLTVYAGPTVDAAEQGVCRWLTVQWGESNQAVVRLRPTHAHFGDRWWFDCPECHRRAAKLYWFSNLFQCRSCAGLRYWSSKNAHLSKRFREKIQRGLHVLYGKDGSPGEPKWGAS